MDRRAALLLALAAGGCIAPSVLEADRRAVHEAALPSGWRPALPADLEGIYESIRVEGEAGASLWRIEYQFSGDGGYTAAALVFDGTRPAFQTLSGAWTLSDGIVRLSEEEAVRASVCEGHLRLEGEGGTVVLRRMALP
ncbi:MAG: hypothetical protein L0323_20530 [Planctomycetes bacterium]|nr:hypothetical protein [Planctomycetota bacterium]